jgi:NDP-sugar pyrophosphorylase family protein
MAVRERPTDRYLSFDQNMMLSGWKNLKTGEVKISRVCEQPKNFAFSGIQIIQPQMLSLISESGKFSIIDLFLRLAKSEAIYGYQDNSETWMDLGKPDQLIAAEKMC